MRQYQHKSIVGRLGTPLGALAAALALASAPPARAQEGSDAALDALIKEIGQEAKAPEAKKAEKPE